jgi:hypothetical protein
VDEYQDAARRIVEVLGEPAAREFLTLLESDDTIRADAFRQLYERGDKDALLARCTTWRPIRSCVGGWSST